MSKNNILSLSLLMAFSLLFSCDNDDSSPEVPGEAYIQIPDAQFETILIHLGIDSDGEVNQRILKTDAAEIAQLNLNAGGNTSPIQDLTGIEGFVNLTYLAAVQHNIEQIDLSSNTLLDTVYLAGNLLSSLDISNNPRLQLVHADANELTSFTGAAGSVHLKELSLSFNSLETLSIENSSVEKLFAGDNFLESVNTNGAVNLRNVYLKTNKLSTVDFSSNTALQTLVLSDNKIEQIQLDQNTQLTHLFISSNLLTGLDVSALGELYHLTTHNNATLSCIKTETGQQIGTVTKSDHQQLSDNCN